MTKKLKKLQLKQKFDIFLMKKYTGNLLIARPP